MNLHLAKSIHADLFLIGPCLTLFLHAVNLKTKQNKTTVILPTKLFIQEEQRTVIWDKLVMGNHRQV